MPSQCSWCGATASCSCYRMQAYFLHKLASEEGLFVSWNSSLASLLPIHLCSSRFIASSAMLTRCFCDDDDNKYFSLYMTLLKGEKLLCGVSISKDMILGFLCYDAFILQYQTKFRHLWEVHTIRADYEKWTQLINWAMLCRHLVLCNEPLFINVWLHGHMWGMHPL